MKIKHLFFSAILGLMTLTTTLAQAPMSFTYQAVVRNSSGQLVSNATVGVKLSILQGSLNGQAVYTSVQTPRTNANGLFSIIIGDSQNSINSINWADGPYYLKSEVDPAGGSNYTLSTVQQMLSVPYALHAHTVDNANFVEQQVLTMSGDTVFLTGGSFVVLPPSFSGVYDSLTNKPHLFSGVYDSLTNKPVLFSGVYDSLTNKPTNVSAFTNDAGYLTNATLTEHQNLSDVATINDSINSQIKNLYNPTDSMDAVNLRTLHAVIGRYDSIINDMARSIDTLRTLVSDTNPHVTPHTTPIGALSGLFSVGTNKQVWFSKGNLQWSPTGGDTTRTTHIVFGGSTADGTWRFAEHQWDTLGSANINALTTGWIDLFGWGTSGFHNPNDSYNRYSHPSTRSADIINQNYNKYGYGPSTTNFSDQVNVNYDWGIYNAISNGGNEPRLWRTLNRHEWDTLINHRNTQSGIRFAKATVNGKTGVIIVPDSWNYRTYPLNNPNIHSASYNSNVISSIQWTVLENAGCAFLPDAGARRGANLNSIELRGSAHYWLSLLYQTTASYSADCIEFSDNYFTSSGSDRCNGFAVRLVQDVR